MCISESLRTATAAKSAVHALAKQSCAAERPKPPPHMFSLAIDPVFATNTANTNTSNQTVVCEGLERKKRVGEKKKTQKKTEWNARHATFENQIAQLNIEM